MSYETERMDALKYELSRVKAIELGIQNTNENNRYKHR